MNALKDSAILSLKDFDKIKLDAIYPPPHQSTFKTGVSFGLNEDSKLQKAIDHRQRIIDLDKKNQLETLRRLQEEEAKKIFENENRISSEDDYVKQMDKMILYAKVATIRDRQMKDRKKIEEIYKKKEEKLDLQMELERLKEMKQQEEQKEKVAKQQREGALVIMDQIKHAQHERQLQREAVEKEGIEMKKLMAQRLEEERKKLEQDKIQNEIRVKEALEANRIAILNKQRRKQQEQEEERKIFEYNLEKARKEEEAFKEKQRLEAEKELELAKLREKQLKASDNKAELDALRAKRAFEDNERKQRKKDHDDMIAKQKRIAELMRDNKRQIDAKELILAEEAMKEKEEFEKIIKEQLIEIERQKEIERKKKEQLLHHREELRLQILNKQEKEKVDRREILEEGRKVRQNNDEYRRGLEAIKKEKIDYLKSLNIEDKYIVPLRCFTFGPELSS